MQTTYSEFWNDYDLIDAGNDKKLERWGDIITIRPDRNAYFPSVMNHKEWEKLAHLEFVETGKKSGEWVSLKKDAPKEWSIKYKELTINLKLTKFKHVGLFPEQQTNWDFIEQKLKPNDKFLNLFGYTGVASLIAKKCGADVFHCDSVKQVITWSKQNMESSNLSDIYWVVDDALKFAQREVKRGKKYNGIIMDPPAFGLGAKKEKWQLENKLPELLETAKELLEPDGFLILNTYSPKLNPKTIWNMAQPIFNGKKIDITRLSARTSTEKRLDYGELTRIY
jgi:23S rRNA (cytosine1962-C5)-methyltransferase